MSKLAMFVPEVKNSTTKEIVTTAQPAQELPEPKVNPWKSSGREEPLQASKSVVPVTTTTCPQTTSLQRCTSIQKPNSPLKSPQKPSPIPETEASHDLSLMFENNNSTGSSTNDIVPKLQPATVSSKESSQLAENGQLKTETQNNIWKQRTKPNNNSHIPGLIGCTNPSLTTCYLNTAIQCLANNVPFATYFLKEVYKWHNRPEIAEEFAECLTDMFSSREKPVSLWRLKKLFDRKNKNFPNDIQHDSHEFLTNFLTALHDELNKPTTLSKVNDKDPITKDESELANIALENHVAEQNSKVVDLFGGQLISTITCDTCGTKSVKFESFTSLTVEIPTPDFCTLHECLSKYTKEEKMSGENCYYCQKCNYKREATKKIGIWKLPPNLIILLKRFSFGKKITFVHFPVEGLDLNEFVSGPKSEKQYSLYATGNHMGDLEYGHYWAYCMNAYTGQWYEFNDEIVKLLPTGPSCSYLPVNDDRVGSPSDASGEDVSGNGVSGSQDAYNMYYVEEKYLAERAVEGVQFRQSMVQKSGEDEAAASKENILAVTHRARKSKYSVLTK